MAQADSVEIAVIYLMSSLEFVCVLCFTRDPDQLRAALSSTADAHLQRHAQLFDWSPMALLHGRSAATIWRRQVQHVVIRRYG